MNQAQFGDSTDDGQPLPSNSSVLHDGSVWLRFDVWSQWLPMTTIWSLARYTLAFQPHFPLLKDLKRSRELNRVLLHEKNRQKQVLGEKIPVVAPGEHRTEVRYQFQYEYDFSGENRVSGDVDLASDLFDGTLQLGASLTPMDKEKFNMDFWRYRQLNQPSYALLDIGHTTSDLSVLLPSVSMQKGIKVKRLERVNGAGILDYEDRTQPDTEIDVYRNGFLQETLKTGKDGVFRVEEQLVSGNDRLALKFYFPDGSEQSETIAIAPDNALILDARQWDGQLVSGEVPDGWFSHASLRYGLVENFTMGTHLMFIPSEEGSNAGLMLDTVWRPWRGLNLTAEAMVSKAGLDYGFRADFTGLSDHVFQFESRNLADDSVIFDLPSASDIRKLIRLRHQFRTARWNWRSELTRADEETDFDAVLSRRINRHLAFQLESHYSLDHRDVRNIRFGNIVSLPLDSRLEVYRDFSPDARAWSALYTLQGGNKLP